MFLIEFKNRKGDTIYRTVLPSVPYLDVGEIIALADFVAVGCEKDWTVEPFKGDYRIISVKQLFFTRHGTTATYNHSLNVLVEEA